MADEQNPTPENQAQPQPEAQTQPEEQPQSQSQPETQPQPQSQSGARPQPQPGQGYGQPYSQSAGQQGSCPPMPPYGAPVQNPGYQAQQQTCCQQQPYQQPLPLQQLSGGMKFAWFAVGFLIGIAGPLVAWLTNLDKAPRVKSDALKWSIIGAVVGIALNMISVTFLLGSVAALSSLGTTVGSSFFW